MVGKDPVLFLLFLPSTDVETTLHHRETHMVPNHNQDCKAKKKSRAPCAACMWAVGATCLFLCFRITFLTEIHMLAMVLGVDQKAESATKLNRDAACDLYHSLILLPGRPLPLLEILAMLPQKSLNWFCF